MRCQWRSPLWSSMAMMLLLGLGSWNPARADFVYLVTANTTAIQGVTGFFDLEFDPGGFGSLAATATISNFATNGTTLSLNTTDGAVNGSLFPGPLAINNTAALNDLLENITFGDTLSFTLTLSGPAVTSADSALPGSSFALSLYDANFNPLLTTDPAGTLVTVNLNPDGSTSAFNFPSDTSGGAPAGDAVLQPSAAPEPASILLLACGVVCLGAYRLRTPLTNFSRSRCHA